MKVSLILTCAGKGSRAEQGKNKLLVEVCGKTVLEHSLTPFIKTGLINQYIITSSKDDYKEIKKIAKDFTVVIGGATRTESVKNALKEVDGDIVLIHDGARPFTSERIIKDCIETAKNTGSAITAVPSRDTVASGETEINDYLGKKGLYLIQTPQAFKTEEIKKAYTLSGDKTFNDDGSVYKEYIKAPSIVKGDYKNVKITYKEDFDLFNKLGEVRFGTGFDCHKLVKNRKLILGGVEIPHSLGLLGHSDADVLTHAIMDAILSACSMRDIGYHFPDTDEKYKDADSMKLLDEVIKIVGREGYKVKSVSAVIMAEKPKLLKHIPAITESLATRIGIDKEKVGISATTLEGLGFVGREKGICVSATAVCVKE